MGGLHKSKLKGSLRKMRRGRLRTVGDFPKIDEGRALDSASRFEMMSSCERREKVLPAALQRSSTRADDHTIRL
jgi:hypothetical protein